LRRVIKFVLLLSLASSAALLVITYAESGCCSWHGGVSYCDTSVGRYVCNDGTYSPSCGCARITPKPIYIPTPTPTPKPSISQTNLIKGEVNNAKTEYYKNPHWFREKLIEKLAGSLKASISSVAFYVYTMLPDIK